MSIKYRSNTEVSGRYLIDGDLMAFAIWDEAGLSGIIFKMRIICMSAILFRTKWWNHWTELSTIEPSYHAP